MDRAKSSTRMTTHGLSLPSLFPALAYRQTDLDPFVKRRINIQYAQKSLKTTLFAIVLVAAAYLPVPAEVGQDYRTEISMDFHSGTFDNLGGTEVPVLTHVGLFVTQVTDGGCSSSGNTGTSFDNISDIQAAINNFHGANTMYVDKGYSSSMMASANGELFRPYQSFTNGVDNVYTGGKLAVVKGTYNVTSDGATTLVINKPMTIISPVGPSTTK